MSGPPLARIAWRNLWRNPRRTAITLSGIAFGIFLAVLFTAMQDRSFADMIDEAARLGSGHVTVQHAEHLDTPTTSRTVPSVQAVVQAAEGVPHVRALVPRVQVQAMLATASEGYPAMLVGYDPTREDDWTFPFDDRIVDGQGLEAPSGGGVVLGRRLAENLGVQLGDKLVYTLVDKQGGITGGLARLSGVVETGSSDLDGVLALLPIDALRATLGFGPDEATQVAVFIDDSRRADAVAARLDAALDPSADALTWQELRPELSGFIAMKVGGAYVMEGVILILVAASIFNTLFVSVMERTRELGILRAIGMGPGQVFALILWESLWMGLLGLALGAAITTPLYLHLAANGIDLSAMGGEGQNIDVGGVGMSMVLNVGIFPEHVALIAGFALGATLLAGVLPAWRAGRVSPVEAIQGG